MNVSDATAKPLYGAPLILASASPRRKELLAAAGLKFSVAPAEIDEQTLAGETPIQAALRLAELKARKAAELAPESAVLAADTVVSVPAGEAYEILGKPADEQDAFAMLKKLQGREHIVATSFCICCVARDFFVSRVSEARVCFRPLEPEEILAYISTGEPMDKAGAYAVQGIGRLFITSLEGSYTSVMGLPLSEVIEELRQCGLWEPGMLRTAERR